MTTTADVAVADRDDDEPSTRGALVVADRVVEKIAAQAAAEVDGTIAPDRRLSDRLPGRRSGPARSAALVSGRLVQLRVTVAVEYPRSIVAVTREVRRHVGATVARLCDVEVRDVDVEVGRLRRPGSGRAR